MNDPVKFLLDLINIYSPSQEERRASEFAYSYINGLKVGEVYIDEANNVVWNVSSGSPRIYLIGHIDTVPGMIKASFDGNEIYGRGSVDAKSALSALLHASLGLSGTGCGVTFAAVTDEERQSEGMKTLLKHVERPDFAVFGEPTGTDSVAIAYKGRLLVKKGYRSSSMHSSSPEVSNSAFDMMINDIESIKGRARSMNEEARSFFDMVTVQVVKCGCGSDSALNKTPSDAFMYVDVRFPPSFKSHEVESALFSGAYSVEDRLEGFSTHPESILARAFYRGIYDVLGKHGRFVKKLGTCDGNVLREYYDVPAVAYGPGDAKLSHTDNERVSVAEYLASINVIKESVSWLCANAKQS